MPETAATTISRQTRLEGGDSQSITFRPGLPGTIFIQSTPPPPSARSETAVKAAVQLFRPGMSKPLRNIQYPVDSQTLALGYDATEADLATPGDWTAAVYNACVQPFTFTTDVTFPIANPVLHASVDIPFLNLIFAKVFDAASVKGHVESGNQGVQRSSVSLAQDIASLLHLPNFTTFAVPDFTVVEGITYRIKNLDTDPNYPVAAITASPLALMVVIRVDPASVVFEAVGPLPLPGIGPLPLPGIDVHNISVEILVGFDGSVTPSCSADVHLNLNNLDLSSYVSGKILDVINGLIHGNSDYAATFSPQNLRGYIDRFFRSFMRLGPQAANLGYVVDGQTLQVSYIQQTA